MKLILKRVETVVEVQALEDAEPRLYPTGDAKAGPFALHSEDGMILPCQISTSMSSTGRHEPVTLTVTFRVDGKNLLVKGDA